MRNTKPRKTEKCTVGSKVGNHQEELAKIQGPTILEVAELAVDLWKLGERAKTDAASERVAAAYERAEDRLKRIGFELDPMVGRSYDTNIKAKVVDHEAGEGPKIISKCISPAVFFRGKLVREAEVVTIGGGDGA